MPEFAHNSLAKACELLQYCASRPAYNKVTFSLERTVEDDYGALKEGWLLTGSKAGKLYSAKMFFDAE